MTINLSQEEIEALIEILGNARDEAIEWKCPSEAQQADRLISKLQDQLP